MIILIPAYEPDEKLVDLIVEILTTTPGQPVLIVDDGSGDRHQRIFEHTRALGCTVVHHDVNRGKGTALKTGFAEIADRWPGHDVVCADCDGQHRATDIERVAAALAAGPAPIVLGARSFSGEVPLRSRFGNAATHVVFSLVTGQNITDTQTGLRGYRSDLVGWLGQIDGERFEYELNVLLRARTDGVDIAEVDIETIYLEQNASSHFRPLVDSARIYAPLVKFSASSLGAFLIDFVVFLSLWSLGAGLAVSVVGARVISATFNYLTNRRFVFQSSAPARRSASRYFALVAVMLAANYGVLRVLLDVVGLGPALAKLATEAGLFVVSFLVQRRLVFSDPQQGDDAVTHVDLDTEHRAAA